MIVEPRFKEPSKRRPSKAERDRKELAALRPQLLERSLGRCEARGFSLMCTGYGIHVHHRVRRAQGGHNSLDNLLFVCEPCHAAIHANPQLARERGLLAEKGNQ